jgi:nucleotide-binding universal stress UspA family protein
MCHGRLAHAPSVILAAERRSAGVYESIVVGTDGSPTAQCAVAEATRLGKALGCRLHVVSAYEPLRAVRTEGTREGAATVLPDVIVQAVAEEAAASVRISGVDVQIHTVKGDPADALIAVAREEKAGLIVVGSCGMHGVTRVLGSVPNKVSHRARCSVLIVATEDTG